MILLKGVYTVVKYKSLMPQILKLFGQIYGCSLKGVHINAKLGVVICHRQPLQLLLSLTTVHYSGLTSICTPAVLYIKNIIPTRIRP